MTSEMQIVMPTEIPHFRSKKRTSKQGRKYEKYMASPEWAAKKDEFWSTYGRACRVPGCSEVTQLHVHHHTYVRLGHELLTDLVGLCQDHHEEVHAIHRANGHLSLTRATEVVVGVHLIPGPKLVTKADLCPNCLSQVSGPLMFRKVNGKSVRVKVECALCVPDDPPRGDQPELGSRGTVRRRAGHCGGCNTTELLPGMDVIYVRIKPPIRRSVWIAVDCQYCWKILSTQN